MAAPHDSSSSSDDGVAQVGGRARPGVRRWRTLEHEGVAFPEAYVPHGVPVTCRGRPLRMTAEAEEAATLYARLLLRRAGRAMPARFDANFWEDWSRMLRRGGKAEGGPGSVRDCDFTRVMEHVAAGRPERARGESVRPVARAFHATVDGVRVPMAGYRAEGASIFVGRGAHPLTGRVKPRVRAEDVTINVSEGAKPPAGAWKAVVHDPYVDWLASWKDPLTGAVKYATLAPTSELGQGIARAKFELARRFCRAKARVARAIDADLASPDRARRQVAACCWLLLRTGLRVGTQRRTAEAGTYGLTTLEARHARLRWRAGELDLDFLGKDAVPFRRSVRVDDAAVLRVLRSDCAATGSGRERVFDAVNAAMLNAYLGAAMPGLTAKVVRTCLATDAFQREAGRVAGSGAGKGPLALLVGAAAAAFVCNHRKGAATARRPDDEALRARLERLAGDAVAAQGRREVAAVASALRAEVRASGLALSTSRANYVDPRVAVEVASRAGLPPEAALPGRLKDKYSWALQHKGAGVIAA